MIQNCFYNCSKQIGNIILQSAAPSAETEKKNDKQRQLPKSALTNRDISNLDSMDFRANWRGRTDLHARMRISLNEKNTTSHSSDENVE